MAKKQKMSAGQKLSAIRKVCHYVKKYTFWVLASVLLAGLIVVLSLSIPILVGKAIDGMIGKGQVDFNTISSYLWKIGACAAGTALCQWLMDTINNRVTYSVIRDMRRKAFRRLQKLPLSYMDSHPSGELVSRLIADVDQFSDGLLMGFTQFFTGVLTIIGTLLFMLSLNPGITLVVVLITPLSLFVAHFIARRTYTMFQKQSAARGEQTALVDELLSNPKAVAAFGQEKETLRQFDEINERLEKYSLRAIFFSSITNPSTRFVNSVVYAGVALTGALTVVSGGITVGQLSCFLGYANQYTKPFNEISGVSAELQNALACAARLFDLIAQPAEPDEDRDAVPLAGASGQVELNDVSFSYRPEQKLIENLRLSVKPGQRIAVVGPTGCGKTTLINLLMRFYDTDGGNITVDDYDIRHLTRKSLRRSYGMVLQDTWLKKGTIRENIVMGKPEATEEEILSAAKLAHSYSFIRRLPDGFDTQITEDGGNLSAGQKQLLCITRVMLCRPPMLLLDEATSSIDTRTEIRIQRAFSHLMEGRTSFIVAHRLSTIREADMILVMREGKIVEQGTHEELLAQNGFYADLYEAQFSHT